MLTTGSWTPMGGKGGGAVKDRPAGFSIPKSQPKADDGKTTKGPKTVSVVLLEKVKIDNTTITGETEPRYDSLYERQEIKLSRKDDYATNSNLLEFRSSMKWPGPLVAFHVHDADGKVSFRYQLPKPVDIPADYVFALREGSGKFLPVTTK